MNKAEIKILVVDDEEDLCEILKFNLESEGYHVDTANSAEEALQLNISNYSLLLLDVMMGEISGFKLATHLKKISECVNTPIIFLTAKDTEADKLRGFSVGADDYISKPFSTNEVIARVKAVLNRTSRNNARITQEEKEKSKQDNILEFEDLKLNITQKNLLIKDQEVILTKREFELLKFFLKYKNVVLSREQIAEEIWKEESFIQGRTIDVNITRLRKKIKPYDKNLITRQGYGYIFNTIS
jgi:DNA-binding response OmpR family regulator